jgi:hypothetical protein
MGAAAWGVPTRSNCESSDGWIEEARCVMAGHGGACNGGGGQTQQRPQGSAVLGLCGCEEAQQRRLGTILDWAAVN